MCSVTSMSRKSGAAKSASLWSPAQDPDRKEAVMFMAEDRAAGKVMGFRYIDRSGKRPKLKPLEVDRPKELGGRMGGSMLDPERPPAEVRQFLFNLIGGMVEILSEHGQWCIGVLEAEPQA
jgi:hypothetical protein